MSGPPQPSGVKGARSGSLLGRGVGAGEAREEGSHLNSHSKELSVSLLSGIRLVESTTSFKVCMPDWSLTRDFRCSQLVTDAKKLTLRPRLLVHLSSKTSSKYRTV